MNETQLNHLRRLRKVLFYIEEHLYDDDISLHQLAKVGSFSKFHFQRIFHSLVGESPGAYMRRLRLELAAQRLRSSDESVTDIALETHYETPSAFTKAFKKVLGVSPTEYRTRPTTKSAHIQKESTMKTTFVTMPDQKVVCVRKIGDYHHAAPESWKTLQDYAKKHHLINNETRFFCISHDNPKVTKEENLRFDSCMTVEKDAPEEGEVTRMTLKGGYFATFVHSNDLWELEQTFDRIFSEWLPASGETLAERPCFVEMLNLHERKHDGAIIYIPLKK